MLRAGIWYRGTIFFDPRLVSGPSLAVMGLPPARMSQCERGRQQLTPSMEDNDLFLAMFGLAIAAVMLVAGGLFLIAKPETPEPITRPVPAVISSLEDARSSHQTPRF